MTPQAEIQRKRYQYLASIGGIGYLREADDTYNDINREEIETFKSVFGTAFLGRINFSGEQHKDVVSGKRSVFEEYVGQKIYNFGCDFVIPEKDDILEGWIRNWNAGKYEKGIKLIDAIFDRIDELGGIRLLWT